MERDDERSAGEKNNTPPKTKISEKIPKQGIASLPLLFVLDSGKVLWSGITRGIKGGLVAGYYERSVFQPFKFSPALQPPLPVTVPSSLSPFIATSPSS
jgi:hypothetical protein